MDATHIDDRVAPVRASHHRHRLASHRPAQQAGAVQPDAALPFWRRPRIVAASLALSTCAVLASDGVPHAPDAVAPKAVDAHAELVLRVSAPASSSHEASSPGLAASSPVNEVSTHTLPHIRPVLSDQARLVALQEGKRLRSLESGPVAAPAKPVPPVESASTKTVAMATVPADGVAVYALATDITHTRIASELRQQLMGSSATVGDLPGAPRTELMQVGAGWRAVVWPFATETEADKARRMLAERGIRTELLKF